MLSTHVGHDWIPLLFLAFWHISSSSCSSAELLHMSLQAAFPMMQEFLSCERPSLVIRSSAQMSYNTSGSSPAVFTLYWIVVNSFRCLCIIFPFMPDSVPIAEGRSKAHLTVFAALPKGKGQVTCKVSLPSRTLCLQAHAASRIYPIEIAGRAHSSAASPAPSLLKMSPHHHLSHNQLKLVVFHRISICLH